MENNLPKRLVTYAELMDEAANLIEQIPPAVFETLKGHRYPLCDELGGAAGMARDDLAALRAAALQGSGTAAPELAGAVEEKGSDAIFDAREQAGLLAALRYWQRAGARSEGPEQDIATDSGTLEPLSASEIDALCERLNFLGLRADFGDGHPVNDEYTTDHVRAAAAKFLQNLEHDLGNPQTYALVCLQNLVEANPHVCHSHDYLDANMTMAGAVAEALGVEPEDVNVQNANVLALWNKAWDVALHDMREFARTKLPEALDRLGVMRSVYVKAPSLGLDGRLAVLATGQEIYGAGFANSEDAITFVTGLNAIALDALESRPVLEAVEGVLASKADRGDKVARNLWTVVVDALKAGSGRNRVAISCRSR